MADSAIDARGLPISPASSAGLAAQQQKIDRGLRDRGIPSYHSYVFGIRRSPPNPLSPPPVLQPRRKTAQPLFVPYDNYFDKENTFQLDLIDPPHRLGETFEQRLQRLLNRTIDFSLQPREIIAQFPPPQRLAILSAWPRRTSPFRELPSISADSDDPETREKKIDLARRMSEAPSQPFSEAGPAGDLIMLLNLPGVLAGKVNVDQVAQQVVDISYIDEAATAIWQEEMGFTRRGTSGTGPIHVPVTRVERGLENPVWQRRPEASNSSMAHAGQDRMGVNEVTSRQAARRLLAMPEMTPKALQTGSEATDPISPRNAQQAALAESIVANQRLAMTQRIHNIVSDVQRILDPLVTARDREGLLQFGINSSLVESIVTRKSTYPRAYGSVLEDLVNRGMMANPELARSLEYTANQKAQMTRLKLDRAGRPTRRVVKGKPDWTGRQGSPFAGLFLDLTTENQIGHHTDPDRGKFYGENLLVFPYRRPE